MDYTVRPFNGSDEDYQGLCDLEFALFGDRILPETIRREDAKRSSDLKFARLVAEQDGRLVGIAQFSQHRGAYHPHKFDAGVGVHPDFRRRGIGGALYDALLAELTPHKPIQITTMTREGTEEGFRFGAARGYHEVMRMWESHFDLQQADLSQLQGLVGEVEAKGYEIKSMAELEQLPDFWPKLHELVMEVRQDVPSPMPMTPVPYEEWAKNVHDNPHRYPAGYMVAMHGEEWVGISTLFKSDEAALLQTGLTAVKRNHRGSGITKALKLRALGQAKADGFKKVKTWNESGNVKMLAINERLGFVRQPAWVSLQWNAPEA